MNRKKHIELFEKYLLNKAGEEDVEQLLFVLKNDSSIQYFLEEEIDKENNKLDKNIQENILNKIRENIKPDHSSKLRLIQKTLRWAAIFLVPIASIITTYYITRNLNYNKQPLNIVTGLGEQAYVDLPDRSKVWINSGSKLSYDHNFNKKSRTVVLQGEAYFEVAEDKSRPFIVKTNEMEVKALGTAFNVNSYEVSKQISTILLKGSIEIKVAGYKQVLSMNQRAIYDKVSQKLYTDIVETRNYVEWKRGNIYFDNQTFEEVAQTLSRVYNVNIQFDSETLHHIRFSGTLGRSSIKNTLDILSLTSPMRYEMKGTTIVLFYSEK